MNVLHTSMFELPTASTLMNVLTHQFSSPSFTHTTVKHRNKSFPVVWLISSFCLMTLISRWFSSDSSSTSWNINYYDKMIRFCSPDVTDPRPDGEQPSDQQAERQRGLFEQLHDDAGLAAVRLPVGGPERPVVVPVQEEQRLAVCHRLEHLHHKPSAIFRPSHTTDWYILSLLRRTIGASCQDKTQLDQHVRMNSENPHYWTCLQL